MEHIVVLKGLPKISLNDWYSSKGHWSDRVKLKETYVWLIRSQFKKVLPKVAQYTVSYEFCFRVRPLDASNTIAMIKLIEDIIFEDDKWDIITEIKTKSYKGKEDFVKIKIESNEN